MTKEEELRKLPTTILKGFRLLFICLTIGILAKDLTTWNWIEQIIDWSIVIMTIMIIIIINKIKKKEKEEKTKGEK